ncbi:hypothetical protein GCM10019016_126840 [Streptomyces prasinosporus]|uniref:Lipoprotein n=1 Tax=Streptomyces prasinosporus TaxID=68256 RepID=A0ABP6UH64_9ACTN
MKKVVAAAALSLMLAVGCSSNSDDAEPADQTSAVASPTDVSAAVDAASDPVAEPDPITLDEIDCYGRTYATPEEAWAADEAVCEATVSGTEMSDGETKAVTTAYGAESEGDVGNLATLYGMCARTGPRAFDYLKTAGSPEQLAEVRGMLLLCPAHPDKGELRGFVREAEHRNN